MKDVANRVHLDNGVLGLTLELPGAPESYRGTRFSWAGIVSAVTCHGHRLFGSWRPGPLPADEHDNVTGTAGEFGMGTAGMPPPLGFGEAGPGGSFVKIGVGILRRPDDAPYRFAGRYELLDSPRWEVQASQRQILMRQSLAHEGWGWEYTHAIELASEQPAFVTRHTLTNTGARAIDQTHYSHNFVVVDGEPVGPDYEVVFPFAPDDVFADSPAVLRGSTLSFRELLQNPVFGMLSGFDGTAADNRVTVRHASGVELRITGDSPIVRYHLFAAPGAVCPEPFVAIRLDPGETAAWQHRYDVSCDAD